jgi:hypothetical protein
MRTIVWASTCIGLHHRNGSPGSTPPHTHTHTRAKVFTLVCRVTCHFYAGVSVRQLLCQHGVGWFAESPASACDAPTLQSVWVLRGGEGGGDGARDASHSLLDGSLLGALASLGSLGDDEVRAVCGRRRQVGYWCLSAPSPKSSAFHGVGVAHGVGAADVTRRWA